MDHETLNIAKEQRYQKARFLDRALTHARQFLSRQSERKHADVCWFALDCLSVRVLSSTREEERYCSLSFSLLVSGKQL